MELIGILLAIVVSLLWYLPCVRALGKNRTLDKRAYLKTAFLYGLLYACLLIIITEIAWDAIFRRSDSDDLWMEILSDFFRAALLEEFFKLTGFLLAKRDIKPQRKIDYILIAGLIGLMYSVVEKAVLGNPMAVIIGLAIPMHILWQFNQGGHYFEYEQAKAAKNGPLARRELFLAVGVPFLLHGCWDSVLSIISYCLRQEGSTALEVIGGILMVATLAFGIIYTIITIRKVYRLAKQS